MVQCPQCEGKKKITVTVHADGKVSKTKLTCITCDGKGVISSAQAQRHQAMLDMWCTCENVGDNVRHTGCFPDCYSHLPGCGKVVQVG